MENYYCSNNMSSCVQYNTQFFQTCMTELSRLQSSPWQASWKLLYKVVWYPSRRDNSSDFFQWNFWKLFMLEKQTSLWEIYTLYQELSRPRHVFKDFWSKWKEIHRVVVNSSMFRTLARPRRCKFKYFPCWIHCMNKKPFTVFLRVPGEWFCCQIFYVCVWKFHMLYKAKQFKKIISPEKNLWLVDWAALVFFFFPAALTPVKLWCWPCDKPR